MNSENGVRQESKHENLADFLERVDQFDGPVKKLLEVLAQRLERNPAEVFKHSVLFSILVLIILTGLGLLVWYEKIDSNALMLLVGLVLGIISNHVKGIFGPN